MTEYFLTTDASWAKTRRDLERTMGLWGVKDWEMVPIREPLMRDDQTVTIAFVHPKRGEVRVSMQRGSWPARYNLRALYLSLEDLRMVDKRGMLEVMGEVLTQLAPPRSPAHETLGIRADATPDEIRGAYRRLAKEHHPDVGGDNAVMVRITQAYESLMRETVGRAS